MTENENPDEFDFKGDILKLIDQWLYENYGNYNEYISKSDQNKREVIDRLLGEFFIIFSFIFDYYNINEIKAENIVENKVLKTKHHIKLEYTGVNEK